ncbi:MAG: nuclear transport factor 2 family protein [Aeromicrobium sp.]
MGKTEDILDIQTSFSTYAAAMDTKQWSLLESIFAPDISMDFAQYGGLLEGYDPVTAQLIGTIEPLDVTQHLVGNVRCTFVDADTVDAVAYFHAMHVKNGTAGGDQLMIGGMYHDRVQRTAGGWRQTHRRIESTWSFGNAAVLA